MWEFTDDIEIGDSDVPQFDGVELHDISGGTDFIDPQDIADQFDQYNSAIDELVAREMERIERALRGAIRAGYDGVDINRAVFGIGGACDPADMGIQSIEPWHRPAPDEANGYRTERYTWDWFSDDELTRILQADDLGELKAEFERES